MASRIAGVGLVTVSERRSITDKSLTNSGIGGFPGCWAVESASIAHEQRRRVDGYSLSAPQAWRLVSTHHDLLAKKIQKVSGTYA
jgi:hypothetical protein